MKIHQIRERLTLCNPTIFQELCDSLLALQNKNYKAFSRSGAHKTKQKTTRGTPDSYFLFNNGKYLFVEATTREHKGNELINKLRSDINSCLDEEKTGIPVNKICEIVLCYNSKLKPEELETVNEEAVQRMGTPPMHLNIDIIAEYIFFFHKNIASEYLNLPLGSGQIISIEKFIDEHDNQKLKLATPLNTVFHARNKELKELKHLIQAEDIVLVSGAAGVGKTRVTIEAVQQFLSDNLNFNAHAVSSKGVDFFDLDSYFGNGNENILFVDDVNRIDKFDQIVKWSLGIPKGKFKLILTVRDYALKDVLDRLIQYKTSQIVISGFSDDDINAIIGQEPFLIKDWNAQRKINEIAKGNPRIAIMLARILQEKGSIDSLNNVSELFEHYFQTFVTDNDALKNKNVLKVLGILSFFYTLPYNEDEVLDRISNAFKISSDEIKESFDVLHELDLIEMDYNHVKIAEQNLATYFFYRTFIKKATLSFENLWIGFHSDYEHRFRDSIYSVEKTFDSELLLKKIKPTLLKHWSSILSDEKKAITFLNFSWQFLPQETFDYVDRITQEILPKDEVELTTSYDTNDFVGAQNEEQHLHLLAKYFDSTSHLKEVIYLCVELIKKKPERLPQLTYHLDQIVYFSSDDSRNYFVRQQTLLKFLTGQLEATEQIAPLLFIHLSRNYLEHLLWRYNDGEGDQQDDPRIRSFKEMRILTLETLFKLFSTFESEVFDVLLDSFTGISKNNRYTLTHDFDILIPWIEQELDTNSFHHCYFVQEMIRLADIESVKSSQTNNLKKRFKHQIYSTFSIINWDRRRGKYEYDFENFEDFLELKNKDISNRFTFQSELELEGFVNDYKEILDWDKIQMHSNYRTIDAIVKTNFRNNEEIGYQTFLEFIKLTDSTENNGDVIIHTDSMEFFASYEHFHERLWNDLDNMSVSGWWKFRVLMLIHSESIKELHINRLLNWIKNYQSDYYLRFQWIQQYEKYVPNLRVDLLNIVLDRNESEDIRITISDDFFKKSQMLENDLTLFKKTHIQQYNIQHVKHRLFDLHGEVMLLILRSDSSFLLEFVKNLYSIDDFDPRSDEMRLSCLWKLTNFETYLTDIFLFVIEMDDTRLFHREHFVNSFFGHQVEYLDRADEYLVDLIAKYSENIGLMKLVFNIVYHSRKSLFNRAFVKFLSRNQNVDDFKKIKWAGNQTIFSGGDIVGDLRAAEWQKLIDLIEYNDLLLPCRSIVSFLRSKVDQEKSYGESERRRSFLGKYY